MLLSKEGEIMEAVCNGTNCYQALVDFFGPNPSNEEVMYYLSEIVETLLNGDVNAETEILMHHVYEFSSS